MTQRRNLSVAVAIRARALLEAGISQSAVALQLCLHHTTIGRLIKRFQDTASDVVEEFKAILGVPVTGMTVFYECALSEEGI